jgi:hypothetical protein
MADEDDPSWHSQETFKSIFQFAIEGLKLIALINAGGAVAIAAYGLGKVPGVDLAYPMAFFLTGTGLVAFSFAFAYATQIVLFGETIAERAPNKHVPLLRTAAILGFASVVCFCLACWSLVGIIRSTGVTSASSSGAATSQRCPPEQHVLSSPKK